MSQGGFELESHLVGPPLVLFHLLAPFLHDPRLFLDYPLDCGG